MKDIKIIKRNTGSDEQKEMPAVHKQMPDPAKFQRETTITITGWINDWRGRKQTDARTAFNDLFGISDI